MQSLTLKEFLIILFIALTAVYFYVPMGDLNLDKVFLTISTFLFSIFTGFFISRQGTRYTKIRDVVAHFDGKLSAVYRTSGHIDPELQTKIGDIISKHYTVILDNKSWDWHFTHKSDTITSIHALLDEKIGNVKQESLRNQSTGAIVKNLDGLQELRKMMVMLHQERIPQFQWILIIFFMMILLTAVSVIPSWGTLIGSLLKAAFAVSIVSVVFILKNLDNLHLFEGTIGGNSAEDVLGIIRGHK